jgi:hypothetical protein
VDDDISGVSGVKDDGAATCAQTTNEGCTVGRSVCVTLEYDDGNVGTGAGCTDDLGGGTSQPLAEAFWKGIDPRITAVTFCTGDKCNYCSSAVSSRLSVFIFAATGFVAHFFV